MTLHEQALLLNIKLRRLCPEQVAPLKECETSKYIV